MRISALSSVAWRRSRSNGQNRTFARDDVEAIVDSPVSFMPAGLVHSLTDRELRDLIAFLENQPAPN